MNTLREALQEYLALRRGLGYKMHDAGRLLPRFVSFLEECQASYITARLALDWIQQATTVQPAERARRLCFVRGFARYRSAADARTEIPPSELLPYRSTRARPHLYTDQEVQRFLVRHCNNGSGLPCGNSLRNTRVAICLGVRGFATLPLRRRA